MPAEFFSATELVLGEDGVLVKQERPAGSNNVGMVGWHCFMKTPEYPEDVKWSSSVTIARSCPVPSV